MNKKISRNGAAALAYAEKFGFHVIPLHSIIAGKCSCGKDDCNSPGKHPRTRYGVKDGTIDTVRIKNWWGNWHEANVGLVAGQKSCILVIDVDKHGDVNGLESLKAKEADIGKLPDTVTQLTGGGGIQLFFKYPGQKVKNGVNILPGVDIRSDDGYVVAPPSNHKSGQVYSWKEGCKPGEKTLAELPQTWIELLTGANTGKKGSRKPFTLSEEIPDGTRNHNNFKYASSLRSKGMNREEIIAALKAVNPRNKPELTDDEIEEIADSVMRYEPGINVEADPEEEEFNRAYKYTPYRVKFGRLKQVTKKKDDGTEEYKELANFVAYPSQDILRDDGKNTERYFSICGRLYDGTPLDTVTIPASKFMSMSWITDAWGMDAIISPGNGTEKTLRHAIQILAKDKAESRTVYIHTGWRNIKGSWAFLYNGGAISAENISVELEGALTRYAFPEPARNYKEAAAVSFKTLEIAPLEITIPLLALTYLTPLNEFFRQAECEPAFALWLIGKSGAKKSTLASVFLSHFGSFSETALPFSFRDTQNSLEKVGFLLKDMLMVIDDYHPTGTRQEKQRMEATAQAIMRGYGDRRGRGRMTNDTTLKEAFVPRGNAIVTSEDIPNVGQSGTARYVTVEVNKDDVNLNTLSYIQDNKAFLALSMRGYIEWIKSTYIENYSINGRSDAKDLPALLGKIFKEQRQALAQKSYHGRMPGLMVWLYIGFSTALDYFQDVGVITEQKGIELLAKGEQVLSKLVTNQDETTKEDSPAKLFLSALEELINTQKCFVWSLDTALPDTGTQANILGYYDREYFYLYPETTYNAVSQFYAKRGEAFPVGRKTVFKHLEDEGHIRTQVDGTRVRYDPVKKVHGVGRRLLHVKASSLSCDFDLGNPVTQNSQSR